MHSRLAVLASFVPVLLGAQQQRPADLIITNARVYTADDAKPRASALAVTNGRWSYVGEDAGVHALHGPNTRVIDARGQTIIPGMADSHGHIAGLGQALEAVDLVGTESYDEVIARVVERAKTLPKGTWVTGRGWDQNDWPNQSFPSHEALSRAVPDHPVYLTRVDGHASLVNAAAIRAAGLTSATKDPSGGRIERDARGAPTGVLVDRAMDLVSSRIPASTNADVKRRVKLALQEANRWGLVSVHDAGTSAQTLATYEELGREDSLTLRVYVMLANSAPTLSREFAKGPRSGLYDGKLWVRAVKLVADGALGSRGAALLAPYSDEPSHSGLVLTSPESLLEITRRAIQAGFQVNTHAIGDRANRDVLDVYEKAFSGLRDTDLRFRVEHAQILTPADIPRFAQLKVIPSMQASHQTSDMYWAEKRVGPERIQGAYAWRSLLNTGVIIPNGSDFPVEAVNPLISFHSSVSRQDAKNWPPGGWYPQQVMTRDEALKSMTIWPAIASFMEKDYGSITAGKVADFVVLDRDIMSVPPEQILGATVVSTWLGGRAVYDASVPVRKDR
jgi:predicted amidohydrolase YtcJ